MNDADKDKSKYKEVENMGLGKIKPEQLEEGPDSNKNNQEKDYEGGPENHPGKGL